MLQVSCVIDSTSVVWKSEIYITVLKLCDICIISVLYLCYIFVISVLYLCCICVISVLYLCFICVISVLYLCYICVISMLYLYYICKLYVTRCTSSTHLALFWTTPSCDVGIEEWKLSFDFFSHRDLNISIYTIYFAQVFLYFTLFTIIKHSSTYIFNII